MKRPPLIVMFLQAILVFEAFGALMSMRFMELFVVVATLALTFLPYGISKVTGIRLPGTFIVLIASFVFCTIFLGEFAGYYDKYPWWDTLLHFGSALSFGVLGFLLIFMMFQGDRYAAPAWSVAILSFCVALAIGAIWEMFEYAMDQTFGTNMQKSGLIDTMNDLIIDTFGALIGAGMGYLYLAGNSIGIITKLFDRFIGMNRRMYRRFRKREA